MSNSPDTNPKRERGHPNPFPGLRPFTQQEPIFSFPSSAWERWGFASSACRACKKHYVFRLRRKQSFQDRRSQAELGNEEGVQ